MRRNLNQTDLGTNTQLLFAKKPSKWNFSGSKAVFLLFLATSTLISCSKTNPEEEIGVALDRVRSKDGVLHVKGNGAKLISYNGAKLNPYWIIHYNYQDVCSSDGSGLLPQGNASGAEQTYTYGKGNTQDCGCDFSITQANSVKEALEVEPSHVKPGDILEIQLPGGTIEIDTLQ